MRGRRRFRRALCAALTALILFAAFAAFADVYDAFVAADEEAWLALCDLGYAERPDWDTSERFVPTSVVREFQYRNGLEETGLLDGDTLLALDSGEAWSASYVYMPVHGGKKYHTDADCSGMLEPLRVTVEEADAAGFTPCKRCDPISLSQWEAYLDNWM